VPFPASKREIVIISKLRIALAVFCFVGASLASAAFLPDNFGGFERSAVRSAPVQDPQLWDEFGLQESEQATYTQAQQTFVLTAYRLTDSTGAYAAFQWQRPEGAKASPVSELSAVNGNRTVLARGNYLLIFEGHQPSRENLDIMFSRLPRLETSPLPTLATYFPFSGMVQGSERHILGPQSLERFESRLPASVVAFNMSAEGQVASFRDSEGRESRMALFYYPTPHIARDRAPEFEKIPGATVKRTGPLVAILFSGDPEYAQRLLSQVRYHSSLSWSEYVPNKDDHNIGDLVVNSFVLAGFFLGFGVLSGLLYSGVRILVRRATGHSETGEDTMTVLHLGDK
jgi:hypothetical protein